MAVTVKPKSKKAKEEDFDYITREEGIELLDRQARKYLGMSGEEFIRRYRAGEIEDSCRSDVVRISMLIPFAEQ
jgi:hypothetical protein